MSTADILLIREAAAKIRERADRTTGGPWVLGDDRCVRGDDRQILWDDSCNEKENGLDDGIYIASWHPAVALAVADWLDTAGADIWAHGPLCICGTGCDACDDNLWEPHARSALAVARAYLGRDA